MLAAGEVNVAGAWRAARASVASQCGSPVTPAVPLRPHETNQPVGSANKAKLLPHPTPPAHRRLKAVPPAVLTGCASLATLSLHGNPLTAEQLRETEGYAAFDERRRRKFDKQVGFGVV